MQSDSHHPGKRYPGECYREHTHVEALCVQVLGGVDGTPVVAHAVEQLCSYGDGRLVRFTVPGAFGFRFPDVQHP